MAPPSKSPHEITVTIATGKSLGNSHRCGQLEPFPVKHLLQPCRHVSRDSGSLQIQLACNEGVCLKKCNLSGQLEK